MGDQEIGTSGCCAVLSERVRVMGCDSKIGDAGDMDGGGAGGNGVLCVVCGQE